MSRCRKFGVHTLSLSVDKGKITTLDWSEPGLPEIDLFVKPLHGQNGKNALCWSTWVPGNTSAATVSMLSQMR